MRLKMSDDGYILSMSDTSEELFGIVGTEARVGTSRHLSGHRTFPLLACPF